MRSISSESPLPKHPDLFSSFPSLAAGERYVPTLPSVPLPLFNGPSGRTNHTAALKRQISIASKQKLNMITYNTSHHISASCVAHISPACACHPSIRGENSANYILGFGLRTGLLRFLAFILRAMNGCHLTTIPTNVFSLPGWSCLEKIQTCYCGHGHGILVIIIVCSCFSYSASHMPTVTFVVSCSQPSRIICSNTAMKWVSFAFNDNYYLRANQCSC